MTAKRTRYERKGEKREPGRPYNHEAVCRETNGRASRAAEPADRVALMARARHTGLTLVQAKDQKAENYLGVLNMLGARDGLSDKQYQAALAFRNLYQSYQKTLHSPEAYYDSKSGVPTEYASKEYIAYCASVKEEYNEARRQIQSEQGVHRHENLWAALDYVILRGEAFPHMVGATRIVCNALARFFGT